MAACKTNLDGSIYKLRQPRPANQLPRIAEVAWSFLLEVSLSLHSKGVVDHKKSQSPCDGFLFSCEIILHLE